MSNFTMEHATRQDVSMVVGIVGSTGSGKTGSALELATGFQDIQGGKICILETDGKRSLAYADAPMFSEPKRLFNFERTALKGPFSPMNYKAGLEYLVSQGVKHAIIDSASHMHEGEGGTLDAHAKEVERISKAWGVSADKANFPAWVKPKSELTHFIQYFKSLEINLIFCFRAKEKMRMVNNKPVDAGWQPIANEELFFEMDLACLLLPNSDGQPIWNHSEHKPIKALPQHFRPVFKDNPRLSAELGRKLAAWAKGGASPSVPPLIPAKQSEAPIAPASHPANELLDAVDQGDDEAEPEFPLDGAPVKPASIRAMELMAKLQKADTHERLLALKAEVLATDEPYLAEAKKVFNERNAEFKAKKGA